MFHAIWSEFYLPLLDNTQNTVKNSSYFAKFMKGQYLDADQLLVSFDIVSLFSKISVDLAIKVAKVRLRNDESLWQRTSLPVEDIINLLSFFSFFSLQLSYVLFEATYYIYVNTTNNHYGSLLLSTKPLGFVWKPGILTRILVP